MAVKLAKALTSGTVVPMRRIRPATSASTGSLPGPTVATESNCISGKCLSFNSTNNAVVEVTSTSFVDFSGTKPFTIEAWVKPTTANSNGHIVTKYNAGVAGQFMFILSNGKVALEREVAPYTIYGNTVLAVNQWSHLVGLYDGTNMKLYVNGKSDATPLGSGSIGSTYQPIIIGSNLTGGAITHANCFDGYLDDIKIYNYARTPTQILADYNSIGAATAKGNAVLIGNSLPTNTDSNLLSGLVGWWKLDENSSPILDSSGLGDTGTWQGTLLSTSGKFWQRSHL